MKLNMTLKAGKYKGREIADVPQGYLGWMLRTVKLDAETSDAAAVVYFGREWGQPDITPAEIRERVHREATAAMKALLAQADALRAAQRAAQSAAPASAPTSASQKRPASLLDFGPMDAFP